MTKENKKVINTAYNFVIAILNYGEPTAEAISELCNIKSGNKKALLEHLKAINSITGDAIKMLGDAEDE